MKRLKIFIKEIRQNKLKLAKEKDYHKKNLQMKKVHL